jgi:hypothetical protein|nr:MAG TPA: hypothetical protein [Bacteriophage sp.]
MLFSLLGAGLSAGNGLSLGRTLQSLGKSFMGSMSTGLLSWYGSTGQTGMKPLSYGSTGYGRSVLNLNHQREQLRLMQSQTEKMKAARHAQSTLAAYMAGRGFAPGGSTQQLLSDESNNNLMQDVEVERLISVQRIMEANIQQLQGDYSVLNNFEAARMSYESPLKKIFRESFMQPLQQNLIGEINQSIQGKLMEDKDAK